MRVGEEEQVLLEIRDLTKRFGGLVAVDNLSLTIDKGEIVGLIGPNGSGKTTIFNCITGFMKPENGIILLDGEDITKLKPHETALKGLGRSFQLVRIFPKLTVLDNMLLAVQHLEPERIIASMLQTRLVRKEEDERRERAERLLDFLGISRLKESKAEALSFGQKKLLEFGRIMMANPKIVLLDEPTSAVNPNLIRQMLSAIRKANKDGVTFFIIEHNISVTMGLCNRIIFMVGGRKVMEGPPEMVEKDPRFQIQYLGVEVEP
jgi:ABC-type branched-subunit amino acid transport system ATPase component